MDKIKKLLQKINAKDRKRIIAAMAALRLNQTESLDIKKLVGTQYYRVRVGWYRIIYTYNDTGKIDICAVTTRDDKTYNDI